MKKVLVIGAGKFQVSGIKKLKEKGYYVIAIDGNENAAGRKFSDEFYNIDIKESSKIIKFIKSNNFRIDGCLCFATEIALRTVADINDYFDLTGLTKEQVNIATSKVRQRHILKKSDLPNPKYICVKRHDEVIKKFNNSKLSFPVVIKPSDNSGSRGIQIAKNSEELIEKANKSFDYSNFDSEIIVEEFIEGIEFTVESLVVNNKVYTLGISEKKKPINNYTVSTELFYNSPMVEKLRDNIETVVNEFISLCNFNNTILHTEVIYSFNNHKIYIIETTVRSGGYGIFDKILPKITGLDIVGITIDLYLGKDVKIDKIDKKPCILRFFNVNQGKLLKISELKDIIDKLHNIEYGYFVKPGDYIGVIDSDGSRPGYLISYGEEWEDVYSKANNLEYAIRFEITNT